MSKLHNLYTSGSNDRLALNNTDIIQYSYINFDLSDEEIISILTKSSQM